jgi:hypothetical protein
MREARATQASPSSKKDHVMTCTIESRPVSCGIRLQASSPLSVPKEAAISAPELISPSVPRRAFFWSILRLYEQAAERACDASGIRFEQ